MNGGGRCDATRDDPDRALFEHLRDEFGIGLVSTSTVHRGEDAGAFVLRGYDQHGASFAVKISGRTPTRCLLIPAHLARLGMRGIPEPLLASSGMPWSEFGTKHVSITPWVASPSSLGGVMTPDHWQSFGTLLAALHAVDLPPSLRSELPREDYLFAEAPQLRALDSWVRGADPDPRLIGLADREDALSRALMADWLAASDSIAGLLDQAHALGLLLRSQPAQNVLCHGDGHVGNILVDVAGQVWLIDWDAVVLAPRERDLKFVLDAVSATGVSPDGHEASFLNGYGLVDIDPARLAYFRCIWALEDLAIFGADIVGKPDWTHQERAHALQLFRAVLSPTGTVDLALRSIRALV